MKPITLDDLPTYSPWPAAILGLNGRGVPAPADRTYPRIRREFEEKYARVEGKLREKSYTLGTLRRAELDDPQRHVAVSVNDFLHVTTLWDAMERSRTCLAQYLKPETMLARSVVDLGCGWGYQLACLRRDINGSSDVSYYGGDIIPAAVRIAKVLGLDVESFNFFEPKYGPLEKVERPSVVTTSFALHQLASSRGVVERLAQYREKIDVVVNLEPEEEFFGDGLLGMLRRRYGQMNVYSADLNRVLEERKDVKREVLVKNAMGANALLPGTITVWRFT